MKQVDIHQIELSLGIKLPQHYVTFIQSFEGIGVDGMEVDYVIYRDAAWLIKMNERVTFYRPDSLVSNKLIVGDNGGGDFYMINLADHGDQRVYVFDHEEFDGSKNYDFEYYDDLASLKAEWKEMLGQSRCRQFPPFVEAAGVPNKNPFTPSSSSPFSYFYSL